MGIGGVPLLQQIPSTGLGGCGRTLHQVLGSHGFLGRNLGRGVGSLEPGSDEEIDPRNPMGRLYIYLHEWLIFVGKLVGKYSIPMDLTG